MGTRELWSDEAKLDACETELMMWWLQMLELSESRALAEGLPETAERINMQARQTLVLACEVSLSCSGQEQPIRRSKDRHLMQVSIQYQAYAV